MKVLLLILEIIDKVKKHAKNKKCVMVILDSNHTHEHVLNELKAYSPLVTVGSYCILPDTFIEFFPKGYSSSHNNRPWDVGNNPYTAMKEFLKKNNKFVIDRETSCKAMITETIDGYLKRI
jgi:cephalosporin hydroxylase